MDAEKRLTWEQYFEHPFVKTAPEEYLTGLKKIYGESYISKGLVEATGGAGMTETKTPKGSDQNVMNKERVKEKSELLIKDSKQATTATPPVAADVADKPKPILLAKPKDSLKDPLMKTSKDSDLMSMTRFPFF